MKLLLLLAVFPALSIAQWQLKGAEILGGTSNEYSGVSVACNNDANIIAIGAYQNAAAGTSSGTTRIYQWDGTSWTQMGSNLNGEASGDNSGIAVDLNGDGTIVAIGAFQNDGNGTDAGHARVYQWNGTAWLQKGTDIDGQNNGDFSGVSVSINQSGNRVAMGSYLNNNFAFAAGSTRIFEWNGSAWVLMGTPINGVAFGDNSGYAVNLDTSGNTIAIGEWANDDNGGDAGQVRIFQWNGSVWIQKGGDIEGLYTGDNAGQAVSLSADGNVVAIGEHRNDEAGIDGGKARVFEWNGSAWIQKGTSLLGSAQENQFGHSVSLSHDGNTLVVGSDKSDFIAIDAGAIDVYEYVGSDWVLKGETIYGKVLGDWFGTFVDISANGSTVVSGAPTFDSGGPEKGETSVYSFCTPFDTTTSVNGVTISANAAGYNYQWLDCNNSNAPIIGENSQSFTALSNGNYAVEISNELCTYSSSCVNIEGVGFDEDLIYDHGVLMYPVSGAIVLNSQQSGELLIYNLQGQLLSRKSFTQGNSVISIELGTGIFLLNAIVAGNVTTQKIFFEH